jgi:hypothetical protein
MNDRPRPAVQAVEAWSGDAPGGSRRIWLWLNEPSGPWWSAHATIHDVFGLTWMIVKEMESREWALATVRAQGQGDDDDQWESCELWTPMAVDEAMHAVRTAFDIARAAPWSSANAAQFRPVEEAFDRFNSLLAPPEVRT